MNENSGNEEELRDGQREEFLPPPVLRNKLDANQLRRKRNGCLIATLIGIAAMIYLVAQLPLITYMIFFPKS